MTLAGINEYNKAIYSGIYYSQQNTKIDSIQLQTEQSNDTNFNTDNDEAIYTKESKTGQSFSIYKVSDYSKDNTLLYVKGINKDGTKYDKTIDPSEINPEDCSYVDFMALNAYLVDRGSLDASSLNNFEETTQNNLQKADYLDNMRDWRDMQMQVGNMVGYNNAVKVCSAICNYQMELNGTEDYFDSENGKVRAYLIDNGIQDSTLGTGVYGDDKASVPFYAVYADDSTLENPIVEVHIFQKEGTEEKIYRIGINDINPENATQMEMFALCSHIDKQEAKGQSYYSIDSHYYEAAIGGIFNATNAAEFTTVKNNWIDTFTDSGIADTSANKEDSWWQKLFNEFDKLVESNSQEKFSDKNLRKQANGDNRSNVETEGYKIENANDGYFTISIKNGDTLSFNESQTRLYKDTETGLTYLVEEDAESNIMQSMQLSDSLKESLNEYFMTNQIKAGVLPYGIKEQILKNDENNQEDISFEQINQLFAEL